MYAFGAVIVSARPTLVARPASVPHRLDARPLADFEILDPLADLDDDTCSFMACTERVEGGHGRQVEVVQHEMDIGHAQTRGIELDEDILRA